MKSPSTPAPGRGSAAPRSSASKQKDGLGFYRVLAGIHALSTFRAKVTAVVIACTFVPAFLLVFVVVIGAGRMSGLALIACVVVLAVAGACAMLWALRRLLTPLEIAAEAIDDLALERPIPRIDLPGSDAVAQVLRGVQALVTSNQA